MFRATVQAAAVINRESDFDQVINGVRKRAVQPHPVFVGVSPAPELLAAFLFSEGPKTIYP